MRYETDYPVLTSNDWVRHNVPWLAVLAWLMAWFDTGVAAIEDDS